MDERQDCIYITTNHNNTVLYVGSTSDLKGRVFGQKNKLVDGFTKKYNLTKLLYGEVCENIKGAIWRFLSLKKNDLILRLNPRKRYLSNTSRCTCYPGAKRRILGEGRLPRSPDASSRCIGTPA